MAKREKPGIIFEKTARGLAPSSSYDAEQIDKLPVGTEFDLVPRTKRSLPQHRTYWKMLGDVVEATGGDPWPTSDHLHDALKRSLGYVHLRIGMVGQPYVATDSIAFDEMDQATFRGFFDAAVQRIAEDTGIDPLAFLEHARAA